MVVRGISDPAIRPEDPDIGLEDLEGDLKEASRPLLVALSDFLRAVYVVDKVLTRFAAQLAVPERHLLTVVDDVRRLPEIRFLRNEGDKLGYSVMHVHLAMTPAEQTARLFATRSNLTPQEVRKIVESPLETEARSIRYNTLGLALPRDLTEQELLEEVSGDIQCLVRRQE